MTDGGFWDSLTVADLLAAVSLVLALHATWKASSVEKRLRRQSDKRGTFDQWISNPVSAKLASLDECIQKFIAALHDNPLQVDRVAAVRRVQITEFNTWFFAFEALCESKGDSVVSEIQERLLSYFDEMLEALNEGDLLADNTDPSHVVRKLLKHSQSFIAHVDASLQSARVAIT